MSRQHIAGLAASALLATAPLASHAAGLDFYSGHIDDIAHELVETIRPTLDPRAQKILDDIIIEAPESWETNASARGGFGDRRIVQFNAGLLAATDWLTQAMIADWAGHEGCLNEYSDYLAGLVDHNSRRMKHGKDRKHVNDFEAYAATTRGQCEGAMTNDLDRGRQEELRVEILDAITVTVLLHEIGHHVLGHVDEAAHDEKPYVRRLLELDADRWAVSTAVNSHYEIRTAVPLFLFLASTGGGTIEDEIRSSHPSGLRRMRDLLIQTRTLLDSRNAGSAHMMDASIDDLNRSVR